MFTFSLHTFLQYTYIAIFSTLYRFFRVPTHCCFVQPALMKWKINKQFNLYLIPVLPPFLFATWPRYVFLAFSLNMHFIFSPILSHFVYVCVEYNLFFDSNWLNLAERLSLWYFPPYRTRLLDVISFKQSTEKGSKSFVLQLLRYFSHTMASSVCQTCIKLLRVYFGE